MPSPPSPRGRAKLRERAKVENSLAQVGHWQERRARCLGLRENLFDLLATSEISGGPPRLA